MKDILNIMLMHLKNFLGHGKSVFFVHMVVVFVWSGVLAVNMRDPAFRDGELWWVFFSVVVSGIFANTAFVSERVTGALEVLLTCGISRHTILTGKVLFVFVMSLLMGLICYMLALMWFGLSTGDFSGNLTLGASLGLLALYVTACFMNAGCAAWLSIYLPNPRFSHFVNLLLLAGIVVGYQAIGFFYLVPQWYLPAVLALFGVVFLWAAGRGFRGERILQPVSL